MKKLLQVLAVVLMGVGSLGAQGRVAASMGVTVTVQPVTLFSVTNPMGLAQSRANGYGARIRLPLPSTRQDESFRFTTQVQATLPSSTYHLAARLDGSTNGSYVSVDGLPLTTDREISIADHLPLGQPSRHTIEAHFDRVPDSNSASVLLIARPEY